MGGCYYRREREKVAARERTPSGHPAVRARLRGCGVCGRRIAAEEKAGPRERGLVDA